MSDHRLTQERALAHAHAHSKKYDATDQSDCKGVERACTAVVLEPQRVERWAEDVGCCFL